MSLCVLAKDNPFGDVVVLEGEFVRTFLKDLPSDYIKIYLFCQYALSNDVRCNSMADLASACSLSINTVKDGIEYFSKERLLNVVNEHPFVVEVCSVREAAERKRCELPDIMSQSNDYLAALRSLIGRDLKQSELEKANEWVDILHMPQQVVMLMVQHCLQITNKSGKKTRNIFSYIDKTALSWVENDILTVEDAEYYISKYELEHHIVNDVMLHIGIRRMPSIEEVKLYEKWTNEWKMSHEAVLAACAETTKVANPSFAYLDKIIENLYMQLSNGSEATEILDSARYKREEAGGILKIMGLADQVSPELLDIIDTAKIAGFDSAAITYIARRLARRSYKSVGSLENELSLWADRGIYTEKQMQEYDNDKNSNDELIKQLYSVMSLDKAVSESDRKIFSALLKSGQTFEVIFETAKTCEDMRALKKKLLPQTKQTLAHNYNSHSDSELDNNIFVALDELEDD